MSHGVLEHGNERIDRPLARLVAEPEKVTPLRLWRALAAEDRERAALALLRNGAPPLRDALVRRTAEMMHYRYQTLDGWPAERIAAVAMRLNLRDPGLADALLRTFHLTEHRALLRDYLDALGVEHEDGVLRDETAGQELEPEVIRRGAERVATLHATADVVRYFLTLLAARHPIGRGLDAWLRDHVADAAGAESVEDAGADEEDDADALTEEPPAVEDTDEFTTLDRQVVRILVDVAQGVEGALSGDAADDLVKELIELNSTRHRTYFHAGFRDALGERRPQAELPAENEARREWYWAGYVQGLARRDRWQEIVRYFDEERTVRGLGRTGTGPSSAAAPHIFQALWRDGRTGDAASFLERDAVINAPGLFAMLNAVAEPLLREDKAAEARAIYDLLARVISRQAELGLDTTRRPYLEVRRRRAHCYRQLGELDVAAALLTELLEKESDPEIRSMVLADLGLIDGGFRRLADLRLPTDPDRLATFRDALARGEPRFEEGLAIGARYAAHAHYCLGVLAFARERYDAATRHLDLALSVFEAERARYAPGGILAYARLYLGLARCLDVQAGRMTRAAARIRQAIAEGAEVPRYLVTTTLQALGLSSETLAREMAEFLLEALGPASLDLLIGSGAADRSERIAEALYRRAADDARSVPARAHDYHRALPILLQQARLDEAAAALDFLEDAALQGIERDRFIDLLAEPERFSPAWEVEDAEWARVRCLEAGGRYADAAQILTNQFHQVLSRNPAHGAVEAEAFLERIQQYGLPAAFTRDLAARLDGVGRRDAETNGADNGSAGPAHTAGHRIDVRVLFVGGDERQAQYGREIEDELRRTRPNIRVTFLHPGWSANWGGTLEDVRRRLETHDGVVISRFVRTEFGRQLRKSLAVPWRGCGGTGKRAMIASILQAAEDAERAIAARLAGEGTP